MNRRLFLAAICAAFAAPLHAATAVQIEVHYDPG